MSLVLRFPPELLFNIAAAVFCAANPPSLSSLDPSYPTDAQQCSSHPTGLPSAHPPDAWSESDSRRTLVSMSLVSKAFYESTKPWLWARIHVRLPQSWLAFVDAVVAGQGESDSDDPVERALEQLSVSYLPNVPQVSLPKDLRESVIAKLSDPPDNSIPPELLSPPASREPSPRRLQIRAKSPGRWRLMRDINHALQEVIGQDSLSVYVPSAWDAAPGKHIRFLDFNHFRTIGMRRSVREGVTDRFVTTQRLFRILQEMPNLSTFGATEYMDGALNFNVLEELLFRGYYRPERNDYPPRQMEFDIFETQEDTWARRRECRPLEALDLCGCVSAVFIEALAQVVNTYLGGDINSQENRRGRRHGGATDTMSFPSLRRLGLRGANSIASSILEPFVLAFPYLTHLDLSGSRCTPDLLQALSMSLSVKLKALAIGRCPSLTGAAIENLLTQGGATQNLVHLSIYGDATFPSPLSESELQNIVVNAPSFKSGKMEYLDLSASPITESTLQCFSNQPSLRSLGLSHIPSLSLEAISSFVLKACVNIEVLTLVNTSPELLGPNRFISLPLYQHIIGPLAKPPFFFSISSNRADASPPTRLRVIELSIPCLIGLGNGGDGWRVVRSKGGRGWYVDSCAGWCGESKHGTILRRDLPVEHPLRRNVQLISDAGGNVSSGIGWHARKMEILHGDGMLGREDGLYGAVSFAFSS